LFLLSSSDKSPSRPVRGDDDDARLDVGTAVEADYRGKGKYFPGKISRVRANGTFDIDYDDGEHEMMVSKDLVRPKGRPAGRENSRVELEVGTAVEADYRGRGKFYSGKISRVRLNGTYDVDYDDGEKEQGVSKELIRAKETRSTRRDDDSDDRRSENLEVGTKVEANYRGKGKFYSGKIVRVRLNGTYDIDYDDGESEQSVARNLIRVKSR
jgi:ribosomal protein L35AE/L33A